MIRDLLKWAAPGAVTVFTGTLAALVMTTPNALADLRGQGDASLDDSGLSWAHIALDGRDVLLTGTTDTQDSRDQAIALLASIPGIRTVIQNVAIAPAMSPYRIDVKVENAAISLSGGVPNADFLSLLSAQSDLDISGLALRAGLSDEKQFLSGLQFALAQAELIETGTISLSDMTLAMQGRVNSDRALGALQIALATLPEGLALGPVDMVPVLAAPYTWTAEFDGKRIAVSGHVPEQALVERIRTADVSGLPIATGLALASGAPDGFAELSRTLIEQLARLDHGSASIVDGVSRISGAPPSLEVAQAVTQSLPGSIVQLAPPPVSDYWVSVTRQESGVLVFDGYAPDQATVTAFAEHANADVNFLKLGSGAPALYQSGVDFGLSLLDQMAEGRFVLNENILTLSGLADASPAYQTILTSLENDLPQGLQLAAIEISPPALDTYTFSVQRDEGGAITLSGFVPDPASRDNLLALAGPGSTSSADYASGQPDDFLASAEQAMDLLKWLDKGAAAFDGTSWTVSGTPSTALDKASLETEFAVKQLAERGWQLDLSERAPPPEAPATEVAPQPEPAALPEAEAAPVEDVMPTQPVAETPEAPAVPATSPAQLALCRDRVAELSAHNAILFQSGNAIIADSADAELDRFGEALALCPDTKIYVEGHTDSDGDDQRNLALSVARAEAVVNALIERDVDPARLYAIGYGESQPIADNATQDGKRQNRRIVVTIDTDNE